MFDTAIAICFTLFKTYRNTNERSDVTLNEREKYLLFDWWTLLGCSRFVSSADEKEGYES